MLTRQPPHICRLSAEEFATVRAYMSVRIRAASLTQLAREMEDIQDIYDHFELRQREQAEANNRDAQVSVSARIRNYLTSLRDSRTTSSDRFWYPHDEAILKKLGFAEGAQRLLQQVADGVVDITAMPPAALPRSSFTAPNLGAALILLMAHHQSPPLSPFDISRNAGVPMTTVVEILQGRSPVVRTETQVAAMKILSLFGIKEDNFKKAGLGAIAMARQLAKTHSIDIGNILDSAPGLETWR